MIKSPRTKSIFLSFATTAVSLTIIRNNLLFSVCPICRRSTLINHGNKICQSCFEKTRKYFLGIDYGVDYSDRIPRHSDFGLMFDGLVRCSEKWPDDSETVAIKFNSSVGKTESMIEQIIRAGDSSAAENKWPEGARIEVLETDHAPVTHYKEKIKLIDYCFIKKVTRSFVITPEMLNEPNQSFGHQRRLVESEIKSGKRK